MEDGLLKAFAVLPVNVSDAEDVLQQPMRTMPELAGCEVNIARVNGSYKPLGFVDRVVMDSTCGSITLDLNAKPDIAANLIGHGGLHDPFAAMVVKRIKGYRHRFIWQYRRERRHGKGKPTGASLRVITTFYNVRVTDSRMRLSSGAEMPPIDVEMTVISDVHGRIGTTAITV